MKNSLSRRLFQKYGLPPRGYQWGATSFLPTQGILSQAEALSNVRTSILLTQSNETHWVLTAFRCHRRALSQ